MRYAEGLAGDDYAWMNRAACRSVDPSTFFPQPNDRLGIRDARRVCELCPVIDDCREYVVTHRDIHHGIWAGMVEREYRALRKSLDA